VVPILHSFKNAQHLNVGVRDILGKEDIRRTTAFLADVAQACLTQICDLQLQALSKRYGQPWIEDQQRSCELIVVALGKLGGREPNYHSDLDVVFLYEAEGQTRHLAPLGRGASSTTTNQHFFGELAQRILQFVNGLGPQGRLYEIDARLRPTGRSGTLAVSLDALQRYFSTGQGQLWERQSLCRARIIYGSEAAQKTTQSAIQRILMEKAWQADDAAEIRKSRLRLEETARPGNLKRGPGGLMDVEFIVQMLQLQFAAHDPRVLQPTTFVALDLLAQYGYLAPDTAHQLLESYSFLRGVEARLRLMNTAARHELPDEPREMDKLAYLLGTTHGDDVASRVRQCMRRNREIFEDVFSAAVDSMDSASSL
jgi:glutamate-ammonia-ligase adenylyltransferase